MIGSKQKGIGLAEIIISVSLIAVAALGISFVVDPGQRSVQSRNDKRQWQLNAIMDSVYQFKFDRGDFPKGIDSDPRSFQMLGSAQSGCDQECAAAGRTLSSCADLKSDLSRYLTLSGDPKDSSDSKTMYAINRTEDGKIKLVACNAEAGAHVTSFK